MQINTSLCLHEDSLLVYSGTKARGMRWLGGVNFLNFGRGWAGNTAGGGPPQYPPALGLPNSEELLGKRPLWLHGGGGCVPCYASGSSLSKEPLGARSPLPLQSGSPPPQEGTHPILSSIFELHFPLIYCNHTLPRGLKSHSESCSHFMRAGGGGESLIQVVV